MLRRSLGPFCLVTLLLVPIGCASKPPAAARSATNLSSPEPEQEDEAPEVDALSADNEQPPASPDAGSNAIAK